MSSRIETFDKHVRPLFATRGDGGNQSSATDWLPVTLKREPNKATEVRKYEGKDAFGCEPRSPVTIGTGASPADAPHGCTDRTLGLAAAAENGLTACRRGISGFQHRHET